MAITYGISYADFWDMTLREIFAVIDYGSKKEDQERRATMEMQRWMTTQLLSPHLPKGRKLKPTDLLQLPWDTETKQGKIIKLGDKEVQAVFDRWDAAEKQRNGTE